MKKVVLKVELFDDKIKTKAMKAVSDLPGVESISVDMKDRKLTLTGDTDPVCVTNKLRKLYPTEIISVGPAKEEKKKEEPKKEEPKKADEKKKNPNDKTDLVKATCEAYHTPMRAQYCYVWTAEENPCAGCVIC